MLKTFIIAEAGVNHNKSLSMALTICDAAKKSGADAVKFQTWITDNFLSPDHPRYQWHKENEMPFDFFRAIKKHCDEIGIVFMSTPDDKESLDFLVDKLGMEIIKVGSANLVNRTFLKAAVSKKLPVILSTGMGEIEDIRNAIHILRWAPGEQIELTLLQCTSCYPAFLSEVNLKAMLGIAPSSCKYGLSDHTPGIEIPIAAVAMGASVVEKHLTLDRDLPGPDHKASLEPDEFTAMVRAIRNVEIAMGDGIKRPCARELEVRDQIRIKG